MATAQKQRNCVSAVVFPNKISTEQQSLMLVKRLLAVAVSCITYLRGIFPESAYGTRYMDDVCVKILREDKNCPGSTQLVKWRCSVTILHLVFKGLAPDLYQEVILLAFMFKGTTVSANDSLSACTFTQLSAIFVLFTVLPVVVQEETQVVPSAFYLTLTHQTLVRAVAWQPVDADKEKLPGFCVKGVCYLFGVDRMLGCYDALQKKYLRMIVLAVYTHPEDPQTITECYHFKFKYTHNGPLLDFSSKNNRNHSTITCADTKKASILLIRKIYVLMQNLSPLPNDVCLTMKLFYYDEVTPSDYQPPGFKEGECEGMIFEGEPMYLNVGEVPTPFHMLKVKVTTEKQRMENVDKSILKHRETNVPLQVLRVDRDDPEEKQDMNEDPVLANKVEDRNNINISEAQGPNLTCEEDEVTKAGRNQNLYVSNPQVDHLASKTSELNVSESRTRSGRIFQTSTVHHLELSSSQDVLPKRRKISEPKEQF